MSGRPLDVLEAALGEEVAVRLKDGGVYHGILGGYDQHMNLVLDAGGEPDPDELPFGANIGDATGVEGTTIIRGDNVVSISP